MTKWLKTEKCILRMDSIVAFSFALPGTAYAFIADREDQGWALPGTGSLTTEEKEALQAGVEAFICWESDGWHAATGPDTFSEPIITVQRLIEIGRAEIKRDEDEARARLTSAQSGPN